MMKPIYKNERGLTLVELLAAIVIGSIIMIFVTSILTQSLNEQKRQTSNNKQHTEMRYVLKLITKDMRKSTTFDGNKFTSLNNSDVATYKFDEDNHLITRNDVVIASNINDFKLTNKTSSVRIEIESLNGNSIDTELYFRSGK